MDIDYSHIPPTKKPSTVFDNFKIALYFVLTIAVVLSVGALVNALSRRTGNIVMLLLITVLFLGTIAVLLGVFWFVLRVPHFERLSMQQFAADNHWKYEGKKAVSDAALLPPRSSFILRQSAIWFTVSGMRPQGRFELYVLHGGVYEHLSTAMRLFSLLQSSWAQQGGQAVWTVIRTSYDLPAHDYADGFYTTNSNGYGYAVNTGNARSQDPLIRLFSLTDTNSSTT